MNKLKVLLALCEPPNNSSGLGTLWAKLSIGISKHLELDFIAPDLDTCFATKDNRIGYLGTLIAIKNPPFSRQSSIKINDPEITGLQRFFWFTIRAYTKVVEKLRRSGADEYLNWLNKEIYKELIAKKNVAHYDFVAVHVPTLELAETVYSASKHIRKSLILVIGDPQGYRNGSKFVPLERTLQQQMLTDCAALIITEATYYSHYQKHFEIDNSKVVFFSDCYMEPPTPEPQNFNVIPNDSKDKIRLLHWGAIAEFRNPSGLIDAIKALNAEGKPIIELTIAGPIFSKTQRRYAARKLGDNLKIDIPASYTYAKKMIADADIYVVIVSNRHIDNIPSKLVEGLSFKRPMLILANANSAAAKFVRRNRIGIVVTSNSALDIANAINQITKNYNDYIAGFDGEEVSNFEIKKVGDKIGKDLTKVLSSAY